MAETNPKLEQSKVVLDEKPTYMADGGEIPSWANTQDILTSDDPQAAIASQGLLQAVPVIQPLIEQAGNAALGNLRNFNDLALRAANGDQDAAKQIAEHHSQLAIGSLGAIPKLEAAVGMAGKAPGYMDKVAHAEELFRKAEEAFKLAPGLETQTAVANASQKLKTARAIANRNKFAEGGAVGPAAAVIGLANAAISPFDSGPMPSGFQDPNLQEPSLEHPLIDPIDIAGGVAAAKIAPSVTDAIVSGITSKEFQNIVGNEIGAIGKNVKPKLPQGYRLSTDTAFPHAILDANGRIAAYGNTIEEAFQDLYKVTPQLKPDPKVGGRYSSKVIAPSEDPNTIAEIKKKGLAFFNPEDFESVVVNKNKAGDVRGSLGLDSENRTLSIKVDPLHQGKGVASKLYEQALKDKGLLRSSTIDQQLEGGRGLWQKFAEENPYHVRQARHPETLKPLNYKVWEAETNVPLRKKEMALETKIDELRDKYHSTSENLKLNPTAKMLRDEYTRLTDEMQHHSDELVNLAKKNDIDVSSIGPDAYGSDATGILELDEANYQYNKIKKARELIYKKFNNAANESEDPKELLQKEINSLIKQHKAINKKSGHTLYAVGGFVSAASQTSEDEQHFAHGGEAKASNLYPKVPKLPIAGVPVSAALTPTFEDTAPIEVASAEQTIPASGSAPTWNDTEDLQGTYGTGVEQAKAALEGLGQGLAGPLAPMVETALGANPEAIRGRAEANPYTHGTGEAIGLIGPALISGGASTAAKGTLSGLAKFTQAGALEAVGKLVGKALPAGETLASKIGASGARLAIENGLYSGSDEVSKMILQDPTQTAESAIAHVGLGAALGGALGAPAGSIQHVLDKQGPSIRRFIENLNGRLKEHIENPDPVTAVSKELGDYVNKIESLHDDVFGPQGLKAQDIGKALPQMNESIALQAENTYKTLNQTIEKMVEKPNSYPERLVDKLRNDLDVFEQSMSKENLTSADVFEAQQGLKQTLQKYAKFDRHVTPVSPEYDFIQQAKSMANKLKTSLEDTAVWGKAGERQAAINKAFSEYLPSLKDFNKKFTAEIGGEKVIDPAKINTYLNQLDKPNAEIKKDILRKFIDASENYKKVINDSHVNLGLESPVQDSSLNNVLATFDKKTSGVKIADFLAHKFAPQALGTSAGAAVGHVLAGPTGGAIGALIGNHSISPFFNKVLPVLAGVFSKAVANPVSALATSELVMSAVKGEAALSRGIKNLFNQGVNAVSERLIDTTKLDKMLLKIQKNPELLLNQVKDTSHYMPDATSALDQTNAQAVNYLNSLRPSVDKQAPFDSKPIPSSTAIAEFQNALKIAQDPMFVLDKMSQGTLTSKDITILGTLYPALYNSIKTKLIDQAIETKSKEQEVPYKIRIAMSMFIAQPLDSTMNPMSIQAAQVQGPAQNSEQAAQPSQGVKSSPALQKMPGMYQTAGQNRQQKSQTK